jgi:Dolichyl-phosphate-mannose-protein mannosyltransferase
MSSSSDLVGYLHQLRCDMSESPHSSFSREKNPPLAEHQVARGPVGSGPGLDEAGQTDAVDQRTPELRFFTHQTAISGLILACVVLFSLYIRVADYGFYEDDYWGIVPWFKTSGAEMWQLTISHLETWPTGRPLNHILPKWFSWLGYHLAGVQGIYFLGFLVHSTNAFLLYLLLRRWLGHWAAVLAGCLFVLLPIDTTRIFLLHSAHIHTSLTFLLVALLVSRTRYWLTSFPVAGLSLLSYETAFLPFIVFPLFLLDRDKRISRGLIHLAGCGLVLLIVFAVRLHLGDARASSVVSGPGEMIWRMVSSLWIGPETGLRTLAIAVLRAPHAQPPFAFLYAALVGFLLLIAPRLIKEPPSALAQGPNRQKMIAVFLGGFAAWIFAYALTLTNYPPTQEAGRLTSTHTAAVFGLACVISAAAAYFRSFIKPSLRGLVTILMSVFVGLLTLYSFRIQSGFASAWAQERKFWQQVLELCPDITPKTRIVLVGKEPPQNEFILSNSWADPIVLGDAYSWEEADSPILFYYDGMGPAANIRVDNGRVSWNEPETLDLNNIIILKDDGKDLTRIDEFKIKEIPFPLETKKLAEPQAHPSPTPLTDFGRFLLKP